MRAAGPISTSIASLVSFFFFFFFFFFSKGPSNSHNQTPITLHGRGPRTLEEPSAAYLPPIAWDCFFRLVPNRKENNKK